MDQTNKKNGLRVYRNEKNSFQFVILNAVKEL